MSDFVFVDGVSEASISLIDINGRVLGTTLGDDKTTIDVRNLCNGIYFVKITTKEFSVTKRIVRK
ncbi:MAG: T9SS type A sorting domain-containing protein [Bacteroidota bacterium]